MQLVQLHWKYKLLNNKKGQYDQIQHYYTLASPISPCIFQGALTLLSFLKGAALMASLKSLGELSLSFLKTKSPRATKTF